MLLGGTRDRAALVQGAILHAALVHSSDNVKVALVAPRGGPRVGDSPVLQQKESRMRHSQPQNNNEPNLGCLLLAVANELHCVITSKTRSLVSLVDSRDVVEEIVVNSESNSDG